MDNAGRLSQWDGRECECVDCDIPELRVVSDDFLFLTEVEEILLSQWQCRVHRLSTAQWFENRHLLRPSRWVVLDLRPEGSWDWLRRYVGPRHGHGPVCPLIGVVEGGFSPESIALADIALSHTLVWPFEAEDVGELLGHVAAARQKCAAESFESRVLSGDTVTFVTHTPSLFDLVDKFAIAARHDYITLLVGETGTGKTTLAKLAHELSPRKHERFLVVSCGALPTELMGSELFGHVKGAFTGADKSKPGKFEAADRGTIVLEEIDTLTLEQQAKLLRVIETGEFEPLGSTQTRSVNTRVIVTSNVDLEGLVQRNRFRADLYYRLRQLRFELPPLRRRIRDIASLAANMIETCFRERGLAVRNVHPGFLDYLKAYSWPGNLRDLQNEVHRAILFCCNGTLTSDHLSPTVRSEVQDALKQGRTNDVGLASDVAEAEVESIERMLRTMDFNRSATARALGISRVTLYNKIRKYGIRLDSAATPQQ